MKFYLPDTKRTPVTGDFRALSQKVGYQIAQYHVPEAWLETRGDGVTVAVLDTGCSMTHEDLVGSFVGSFNCTNPKRITNDVTDKDMHGSHVTGIIAARDNAIGIVGVAPDAKIIPIKVLGDDGSGSFEAIVAGIDKAIEMKVDVINMSLGAPGGHPMLYAAVKRAYDAGIPIICAAGNRGTASLDFPASYKETISVGALDVRNMKATFSQMGPNLDFMAPGVEILSTVPINSYMLMSGTCLPKSVNVYTQFGPKSIAELQSGDFVWSYSTDKEMFEYARVVRRWSNGDKNLRRISTRRTSLRCTDNHPIMCMRRNGRGCGSSIVWQRADQISPGDFIVTTRNAPRKVSEQEIPILDHWSVRLIDGLGVSRKDVRGIPDMKVCLDTAVQFLNGKHGMRYAKAKPLLNAMHVCRENLVFGTCRASMKINLPQFVSAGLAYLCGFYLGDGWVRNDNRQRGRTLYFAECNLAHVNEHVRRIFTSEFGHEFKNHNRQLICNNSMIADIFVHLCGKSRAKDKTIPQWVFSSPRSVALSFVAGLLDSDGHVKRKGFGFSSSSESMVRRFAVLCDYLGIRRNNIVSRTRKIKAPNSFESRWVTCWSITCSLKDIDQFGCKKSENCIVDEKYTSRLGVSTMSKIATALRVERVTTVDKDATEEVFDIEVEGNHNFVADNVVVHNSMAAPWMAGIVVLLLSKHKKNQGKTPIKNVEDVREHIRGMTIDLDSLGHDSATGFGLVDVTKLREEFIIALSLDDRFRVLQDKVSKLEHTLVSLYNNA